MKLIAASFAGAVLALGLFGLVGMRQGNKLAPIRVVGIPTPENLISIAATDVVVPMTSPHVLYSVPADKRLAVTRWEAVDLAGASGDVDIPKLRQGRDYVLAITNTSGADVDVTFSDDFKANPLTIPDNSVGTWRFVVKDAGLEAISETFIEA